MSLRPKSSPHLAKFAARHQEDYWRHIQSSSSVYVNCPPGMLIPRWIVPVSLHPMNRNVYAHKKIPPLRYFRGNNLVYDFSDKYGRRRYGRRKEYGRRISMEGEVSDSPRIIKVRRTSPRLPHRQAHPPGLWPHSIIHKPKYQFIR